MFDFREYASILASISVLLAMTAIGLLGFYYGWYVPYYRPPIRSKFYKHKKFTQRTYRYDAFISYNENDSEWLLNKLLPNLEEEKDEDGEPILKLCEYKRDFRLGRQLIENVVESIDSSRRVILVLSENFLKSNWCNWEMKFAESKAIEENRKVVILIVLEHFETGAISPTLRYLIRTRTLLEWKEDPLAQKCFWLSLKLILK